jgi:acetyltransferase-like isoleucine patch superfamily enzyme
VNFLKRKYRQLALRLYSVGKHEYEEYWQRMMLGRGRISANTRFYPGSNVCNLSGNPQSIVIGHNCHISGLLLTYPFGGVITMGDNCSLSPNSRIVSAGKIEIGNRVLIAHNVNIIDNISHPIDAQLRHEDFMNSYSVGMKECDRKTRNIVIEDDVWIGLNCIILRGVRIGRGAIIGAGSIVTKDVRAWTINVGSPSQCIREIDPVEVKQNNR